MKPCDICQEPVQPTKRDPDPKHCPECERAIAERAGEIVGVRR